MGVDKLDMKARCENCRFFVDFDLKHLKFTDGYCYVDNTPDVVEKNSSCNYLQENHDDSIT